MIERLEPRRLCAGGLAARVLAEPLAGFDPSLEHKTPAIVAVAKPRPSPVWTTYSYRVAAVNAAGQSPWSNIASVTIKKK